jgi:hypothetical protein
MSEAVIVSIVVLAVVRASERQEVAKFLLIVWIGTLG